MKAKCVTLLPISLFCLLNRPCARPEARVSRLFPAQAAQVLSGEGFSHVADGFVPRQTSRQDPVKAAEASLSSHGGLRVTLPNDGNDPITFSLPGGFAVEVRERGSMSRGRTVEEVVVYARGAGESYWTAASQGYEEWVLTENAGDGPIAEWEVRGGSLSQSGEAVEITDAAGVSRVRVTAPEAFDDRGNSARAWLSVKGHVIALYTDARGEALVDPVWGPTGDLGVARYDHTATLLSTGQVLVAGGLSGPLDAALSSAELYDPAAGVWMPTGSLNTARALHTATLLPSGQVLVAGGTSTLLPPSPLTSAELYDPATGLWTPTGDLAAARLFHTATLLGTGQVLAAGGINFFASLSSAELFDPASGLWTPTGDLGAARGGHTDTLLPSGQVMVAGGYDPSASPSVLSSAELYDPGTGMWTATGGLTTARYDHAATLLMSGQVLVAAGYSGLTELSNSELYDPPTGTWTVTGDLATARRGHQATLLASGQVLVSGGRTADALDAATLSSAELYF